jgi:hypothetical protein
MLGKIIQAFLVLMCFGFFCYSYFGDGTVKDLVFWGIILLFNFISKCSDNIIEGKS